MEERFASVAGWRSYTISCRGVLYGVRNKPLAGYKDKDGYHCCYIGPRAAGVGVKIHRLVAAAFIHPIPEGMEVNHLNGIRDDNRIENLEIVTPSENMAHAFKILGRKITDVRVKGEAHHHSNLTIDAIRRIRTLYAAGARQVDLAEQFKTPQTNISMIVRRKAWAHVD